MPPEDHESSPAPPRIPRWALRVIATALLLLVFLGLGLFLSRDWITAKVFNIFSGALTERGVYLTVENTGFSPVRGIVLTGVTAFSDSAKESPVLSISDLAVAVNPFRRDGDEGFSARLTSDSASFTAHRSSEAFDLAQVDLTLYITGSRLRITHLGAKAPGIALDLSADIDLGPDENAGAGENASAPVPEGALASLDLEPVANLLALLATKPQGDLPKIRAHLDLPATGSLTAEGTVSGRDFTWRGTAIDALDLEVKIPPASGKESEPSTIRTVAFPSLKLVYRGKFLRASGAYDLDTDTVSLSSFASKADFLALFADLFPDGAKGFTGVAFLTPPELELTGSIPVSNPEKIALQGKLTNGNFELATAESRKLRISMATGSFAISSGNFVTSDFTAGVLGGSARADASLRPFEKPMSFTGKLSLEGAPLADVATYFGGSAGGPGIIDATFDGSGTPSLSDLTGNGNVRLSGASPVSIPVLKNFFAVLGSVIPKSKPADKTTTITANYHLEDAVISSDDIRLESGALLVNATATVDLEANFAVTTANARTAGATGLITGLAGKALEMEGEGPPGGIQWRFKNLPNLGDGKAAGIVVDGAKAAGSAAGGLIKGIGGAALKTGEVIAPKDDSKPSIGKGLKKILPGTGKE